MKANASSHTERRSAPSPQLPRVLVVEDEPHVQALIAHLLQGLCRVDLAADADAAIAHAEHTTYAAFLVDITLPSERNGIDVLEHLRTQPRHRTAPVVAVTAHALPGDRERFLGAGFDAYVGKPFKGADLRQTLSQLLRTHRTAATTTHPHASTADA